MPNSGFNDSLVAGSRRLARIFSCRGVVALICALFVLLSARGASAVPSFARKYNTSCQTCHTAFPVLNPFGEAFRRNGFRFPSVNGSEDSDAAKEENLPMGQEEYAKTFPNSVWPDHISQIPPVSLIVFGNLSYAIPGSDLAKSNRNTWTWDGIVRSVSLVGAGSFSEHMTYYVKASITPTGAKLAAATINWLDVLGPRNVLNLSLGRLAAPHLTSYSVGNSYVAYQFMPVVSVAGLFNSNSSFILGNGPADGAELNGVLFHRIGYSAGWIASSYQTGLSIPTSEDVYGHVGAKFGGMSLDGEGPRGMDTADPVRPWSETSITLDTFGYRGVILADNGTNSPTPTAQRSAVAAVGHVIQVNLGSLVLNGMFQYQSHHRPYPGTPPVAATASQPNALPGVPDARKGRGIIASGELAYIIYPWLIPAVRAEYTRVDSGWGVGSLLRIIPGATVLLRPNLRLYVAADIEHAYKLPPAAPGNPSYWSLASGSIQPGIGQTSKTGVEQVSAVLSWSL